MDEPCVEISGSRISDRELWACAYKIMSMYGSEAQLYASMRADELLSAGDVSGQRVWLAILKRVGLWRQEPQSLASN